MPSQSVHHWHSDTRASGFVPHVIYQRLVFSSPVNILLFFWRFSSFFWHFSSFFWNFHFLYKLFKYQHRLPLIKHTLWVMSDTHNILATRKTSKIAPAFKRNHLLLLLLLRFLFMFSWFIHFYKENHGIRRALDKMSFSLSLSKFHYSSWVKCSIRHSAQLLDVFKLELAQVFPLGELSRAEPRLLSSLRAQAKLELLYSANESSSHKHYSLKLNSFTALVVIKFLAISCYSWLFEELVKSIVDPFIIVMD